MSRSLVLAALLAAGLAAASGVPAPPRSPATDYYLKFGDIKGAATDGSIGVIGMAWDDLAHAGQFQVDPPSDIVSGQAPGAERMKGDFSRGDLTDRREAPRGMATGRRMHSTAAKILNSSRSN